MKPESVKDIVAFELTIHLRDLKESDYAHKCATWMIYDLVDYSVIARHKPSIIAAAIMNLAYKVYPDNYGGNSKAWMIMHAMHHKALYEPILKVTRKLQKQIDLARVRRTISLARVENELTMTEPLLERARNE